MEDIAVVMAKPVEAKTARTDKMSISLPCGCEVFYKEIGASLCTIHGRTPGLPLGEGKEIGG